MRPFWVGFWRGGLVTGQSRLWLEAWNFQSLAHVKGRGARNGVNDWSDLCDEILSNCGAGEDSWESLGQQEIKPVNPKGNQPWIFIGRTDAESPIFWPPVVKNQLIGKDPDAGKIEGRRRRGRQRMRCGITDSMEMSLSKFWEIVKDREAWCIVAHRVAENQTQLSNWTTKNVMKSP